MGDTHADAVLGELVACGLVTPAGSRYRLAAGVLTQLQAAGYGDDAEETARTAARHYTWWAGHPSVGAERVCAEADAVLAALAVLVPSAGPGEDGEESPAVRLARAAAPAFAAGGDWGAWERALRFGTEASRLAGEVADQAYFHHELGILALCGGLLDRARAELEASIGLRGAVADKRGTVAGRRALALVEDRSGTLSKPVVTPVPGLGDAPAAEEVPDARTEESATPPDAVTTPFPQLKPPVGDTATLVSYQPPTAARSAAARSAALAAKRTGIKAFARRNLVAAGAGAVLAAVLGTVVTLGATSHNDPESPSDKVGVNPSASQGADDGSLGADTPPQDGGPGGGAVPADGSVGTATGRPTDPGPDGTAGTADDPAPTKGGGGPSDTIDPTGGGSSPDPTGSSGSAGGSHTGAPRAAPARRPAGPAAPAARRAGTAATRPRAATPAVRTRPRAATPAARTRPRAATPAAARARPAVPATAAAPGTPRAAAPRRPPVSRRAPRPRAPRRTAPPLPPGPRRPSDRQAFPQPRRPGVPAATAHQGPGPAPRGTRPLLCPKDGGAVRTGAACRPRCPAGRRSPARDSRCRGRSPAPAPAA